MYTVSQEKLSFHTIILNFRNNFQFLEFLRISRSNGHAYYNIIYEDEKHRSIPLGIEHDPRLRQVIRNLEWASAQDNNLPQTASPFSRSMGAAVEVHTSGCTESMATHTHRERGISSTLYRTVEMIAQDICTLLTPVESNLTRRLANEHCIPHGCCIHGFPASHVSPTSPWRPETRHEIHALPTHAPSVELWMGFVQSISSPVNWVCGEFSGLVLKKICLFWRWRPPLRPLRLYFTQARVSA